MLVPSDANPYSQGNNESIRNDWRRARVTRLTLQKRILMDLWIRTDAEVKKELQRQERGAAGYAAMAHQRKKEKAEEWGEVRERIKTKKS